MMAFIDFLSSRNLRDFNHDLHCFHLIEDPAVEGGKRINIQNKPSVFRSFKELFYKDPNTRLNVISAFLLTEIAKINQNHQALSEDALFGKNILIRYFSLIRYRPEITLAWRSLSLRECRAVVDTQRQAMDLLSVANLKVEEAHQRATHLLQQARTQANEIVAQAEETRLHLAEKVDKILSDAHRQAGNKLQEATKCKALARALVIKTHLVPRCLQNIEEGKDITLLCKNEEKIKIHSPILRAFLEAYPDQPIPRFSCALGSWLEAEEKAIDLRAFAAFEIQCIVDYLYGNTHFPDVTLNECVELFFVADYLEFTELTSSLKLHLQKVFAHAPNVLAETWLKLYARSLEVPEELSEQELTNTHKLLLFEEHFSDQQRLLAQASEELKTEIHEMFLAREGFYKENSPENIAVQMYLSICYYHGIGVKKNIREAFLRSTELLKLTSHPRILTMLSSIYAFSEEIDTDHQKALELAMRAVETEDAYAYHLLADLYHYGLGRNAEVLSIDLAKAVEYYELSLSLNFVPAMKALGRIYLKGNDIVAKNEVHACALFKQAADFNDPDAICEVGRCHLLGLGTYIDEMKALEFINQALDMEHPYAFYLLGYCYQYGRGLKIDLAKAIQNYRIAAAKKQQEAINALYKLNVLGVPLVET